MGIGAVTDNPSSPYFATWLSADVVLEAAAAFAAARVAVRNDSTRAQHVQGSSLAVYWVALGRWDELRHYFLSQPRVFGPNATASDSSVSVMPSTWPLEQTKAEAYGAFVAAVGVLTQRFGVRPWTDPAGPCDLDALYRKWFPPPAPPPPPLPLPAPSGFVAAYGACLDKDGAVGRYISTAVGVPVTVKQCEAACARLRLPLGEKCEAFGWDSRGIWCGLWSSSLPDGFNATFRDNSTSSNGPLKFTFHAGSKQPVCQVGSKGTGWCYHTANISC